MPTQFEAHYISTTETNIFQYFFRKFAKIFWGKAH